MVYGRYNYRYLSLSHFLDIFGEFGQCDVTWCNHIANLTQHFMIDSVGTYFELTVYSIDSIVLPAQTFAALKFQMQLCINT